MKRAAERKKGTSRFAVCVRNESYKASLERNKIYRIIRDQEAGKDGDVRIVDEGGEDYLYPADWFVPLEIPKPVQELLLKAG